MSKFFSKKFRELVPYTPGEQPTDGRYIKLNTNESPFPPSPTVEKAVTEEIKKLSLYSDPRNSALRAALAKVYGVCLEQVTVSNGSDEMLNLAFMAFADKQRPLAFPDITYGFYPVFAKLNGIPYEEIPLKEDFSIDPDDYTGIGKTIVIANPNAPTGLSLSLEEIEKIAADANRGGNVLIVDEAYVDFGAQSAVKLVDSYDNLLVIGTFSKSRSMAGARLGFAIGNRALIEDLDTLRYSTNPYNVNRMTAAAGTAALQENEYYMENCRKIVRNREKTTRELRLLGFEVLPSSANFIFVRHHAVGGEKLYAELKKRGILVRHFQKKRIEAYNRITVGTAEQMDQLVQTLRALLEELQI